ncbi:hypothetical protein KIF53_17630 [Chromobacterium subtsugae]|uniref:Uncharacterized protein n=1 Tax=Chromobacterium subtsugae TaxID=251747 RepID=A0ABS7FH98_9NEIS|nr:MULTISPECIES: hypothetical protein [Chromobacterium]KUM03687.1 hypothetical protein Cv017_00845 [Chromobacterium subtsugae]MBW7568712.1 hypothetical protein [Chromobacterium subtsugae]MBW8289458.1 hypothetical protein [Chromobacterium subtsugae]WSE90000.1 hypothetical protein U6115_14000 [Chromobacterium subtsugae]WVH58371.1 hypothetical protein U6151_14020 [Chromobacterium subtsugae]
MLSPQPNAVQFSRVRQFLRARAGNFQIELFSSPSSRNTIAISIEAFSADGVFQDALEREMQFSMLDAAFMIAHGTSEDLMMILGCCQQLARSALCAAGDCPGGWPDRQEELKSVLSLPWSLAV